MTFDERRTVMWSITPESPGPGPYISDLVERIRDRGWRVTGLSVRILLRRGPRLVHIQWPEHVSRGPTSARTWLKHLRAVLLIGAIKLRRHRVVLTAHNLQAHGHTDAIDAWFRRSIERLATRVVVLVPEHADAIRRRGIAGERLVCIPHSVNDAEVVGSDPDGYLLVMGQIHPYRLLAELVDALERAGNRREVLITGKVGDPSLAKHLIGRAEELPWLRVEPQFVPAERLDELVGSAACLVAIQRRPFNTGGPYFALPRGLPVVMTESAQASMLSEEVGPDWIFTIDLELASLDMSALDAWLGADRQQPDLEHLDPGLAAAAHVELYESLL